VPFAEKRTHPRSAHVLCVVRRASPSRGAGAGGSSRRGTALPCCERWRGRRPDLSLGSIHRPPAGDWPLPYESGLFRRSLRFLSSSREGADRSTARRVPGPSRSTVAREFCEGLQPQPTAGLAYRTGSSAKPHRRPAHDAARRPADARAGCRSCCLLSRAPGPDRTRPCRTHRRLRRRVRIRIVGARRASPAARQRGRPSASRRRPAQRYARAGRAGLHPSRSPARVGR
jgi:hypothetical protein